MYRVFPFLYVKNRPISYSVSQGWLVGGKMRNTGGVDIIRHWKRSLSISSEMTASYHIYQMKPISHKLTLQLCIILLSLFQSLHISSTLSFVKFCASHLELPACPESVIRWTTKIYWVVNFLWASFLFYRNTKVFYDFFETF